jgi:hypothetical protein
MLYLCRASRIDDCKFLCISHSWLAENIACQNQLRDSVASLPMDPRLVPCTCTSSV